MLLLLIIFIVFCVGLDFYTFRKIKECRREVKYILTNKIAHRVISKVVLERKIIEIHSVLFFSLAVTGVIGFMHFMVGDQFGIGIWNSLIACALVLVFVIFGLLFVQSALVERQIDQL